MSYRNDNMLIVVDMLEDFTNGRLGSEETRKIIPALSRLVRSAEENGVPILYTNDAHIESDFETIKRGNHSMKGTAGSMIVKEIAPKTNFVVLERNWRESGVKLEDVIDGRTSVILEKWTYSADFNGMEDVVRHFSPRTIYVAGVNTDVCVKSTVMDIIQKYGFRNTKDQKRIVIVEDCVQSNGSSTDTGHVDTLDELKNSHGVLLERSGKVEKTFRGTA